MTKPKRFCSFYGHWLFYYFESINPSDESSHIGLGSTTHKPIIGWHSCSGKNPWRQQTEEVFLFPENVLCLSYLSSIFWFHFWSHQGQNFHFLGKKGMAIPFECFGVEYSFDSNKHRLLWAAVPSNLCDVWKKLKSRNLTIDVDLRENFLRAWDQLGFYKLNPDQLDILTYYLYQRCISYI